MTDPTRQPDLFAAAAAAPPDAPSPDRMRAMAVERIETLLREMRQAAAMPWDDRDTRFNRIVFPQMLRWLPPDEAESKLAEFEAELRRLGIA